MAASNVGKLLLSLPEGFETESVKDGSFEAFFLKTGKERLAAKSSSVFNAKGLVRFMAYRRERHWWNVPVFGKSLSALPAEIQLLLWQRKDGSHCLLLPLVDGDIRATLEGAEGGVRLNWEGQLPGDEPESAALAVVASGSNPFELVRQLMKIVAARLKTFRLREEKRIPAFVDYFGWCTWDAFYHDVDEEKTLAGLASFAKGGYAPGYMVLDDGWQDIDRASMTLQTFGADAKKFPNGLAPMIAKAKSKYGLKLFGVWHAFEGYWQGVDPKGPLGFKYPIIPNQKTDPPKEGETEGKTYYLKLLDPKAASKFYNDYHFELRKAGVDMVKVDNQSSLEDFTNGECGRVGSMRLYQEALQGSTQNYFLGNSIHCMSNGSDVAYNMISANVWRNSDDYYPKRGQDAQQAHVFINAINAFWSSVFCIPDWDMFQTHGPCPEFHAAARALSGGPVYVCDNPNQQNFSIISKLMVSNSKVLKFDGPAQPLEECLYVDAREESSALKILNWRGSVAVLGLFNCKKGEESVKASYGPSSLPASTGGSYASYSQRDGSLSLLGPKAVKELELGAAGWDLVTLSPLENGVAPLGLLEKYAGAAAIQSWGWAEKGRFECSLADGGLVGLYSKRAPKSVACNGKKLKFKHAAKTGLLTFEAPAGAVALIRIAYES